MFLGEFSEVCADNKMLNKLIFPKRVPWSNKFGKVHIIGTFKNLLCTSQY